MGKKNMFEFILRSLYLYSSIIGRNVVRVTSLHDKMHCLEAFLFKGRGYIIADKKHLSGYNEHRFSNEF